MEKKKWKIKYTSKTKAKSVDDLISILLKNRGIKTAEEKKLFYNPPHPNNLSLKDLKIKPSSIKTAIKIIQETIDKKKHIVIFGDYDTDGITATAILWETIYSFYRKVSPYIPDRFSEGYGIKAKAILSLLKNDPEIGLIITVDNGIVANEAVDEIRKAGVNVIISDHHEPGEKYPEADSTIHTTEISGSAVSWIFAREIREAFKIKDEDLPFGNSLELAAMGTVADVLSLVGSNRSFVKHGLKDLRQTSRPGILALSREAGIDIMTCGVYEIGYIISPRINAMGRLKHGLDSLRLLCTTSRSKARELSYMLGKTNKERQQIVDEVVTHAKTLSAKSEWDGIVVVSHESYHEGVIGLAASKLVDEYWRPAIVFSKGKDLSKASARSIPGFSIIKAIREVEHLLVAGGGHTMAAGLTIKTENLQDFIREINKISKKDLTEDILKREQKIDLEMDFDLISFELLSKLAEFEPTGAGNPSPTFVTREVKIVNAKPVGKDSSHLKMTLEKGDREFDAIGFRMGEIYPNLSTDSKIDIAYSVEENIWNGNHSIQLKLKDIQV